MLNKQLIILGLVIGVLHYTPAAFAAEEVIPDSDEIAELRDKATNGDADAQFQLAEDYRKGEGVPQDDTAAREWYEKSANQGNSDAMVAMGFIYRGGSGVPMDKVLSYMWFQLAVDHGNEHAYELRNDVSWAMTEQQILEGRKRASQWKPSKPE